MQYSIVVKHVSKRYGNHIAIDDISFQVKKGEIFAFLGPNGAGKSTTISILSTLLSWDTGSIEMEGYTLGVQNHAIRKELGIVFQGSMLDESLSVKENLLLRCGLYGLYGKHAYARLQTLMKQCHIEAFLHQKVQELSGGQRRKVDIARALIPKPSILILDEPSTGLDPVSRKELWDMIRALHNEEHMTIFMTTHYMEEAEIADHITLLQHGKIVADGTKEELLRSIEKEHLYLYSDALSSIAKQLQMKRIPYKKKNSYIDVEVLNFYHLMSILRGCEHSIDHIELHKGTMEELYLNMLEEDVL